MNFIVGQLSDRDKWGYLLSTLYTFLGGVAFGVLLPIMFSSSKEFIIKIALILFVVLIGVSFFMSIVKDD